MIQPPPWRGKARILIFSTAYFPFVGGAEVAIKEITDRLPDFEFMLITGRFNRAWPKVEKIGSVTVYRLGIGQSLIDKLLLPFLGVLKIKQLNKTYPIDGFWGMMITFATGAGYIYNVGRRLSGKKKIPILLDLQEGDSEEHLRFRWGGLINLSWWLALKQTDRLKGISNFLLERAKKMGYRGPSQLIPNGVDLEKFKPRPENKETGQEKVIITTSRLVVKNGVADLIVALPLLPRQAVLHIYGEGPLKSELEQQIAHLDLGNRVTLFGYLSPELLPGKLVAADVFCRPSLSEGLGISFLEAMAVGLPTVGSRVGGIPEFLIEGETGWLCEPKNPQSIAKKIAYVLDPANALEVRAVALRGQALVQADYSWDKIARQMRQILAELTSDYQK